MADRWSIFSAAVKHCLEGWPALHIAQQQGFGGDNFKDKLDWLLEVIVQIFHDNEHVYPDELQEYLSECLYNEFDIIVDDGTCPKIVEKLCYFNSLCETSQFTKVTEELRIPPPSCPPISKSADDAESDDESHDASEINQSHDNDDNVHGTSIETSHDSIHSDQDTPMDEDGNNDGWEVVRRSKKKTNSRKPK